VVHCREAALTALREDLSTTHVAHKHFVSSREKMRASLTPLSLASYASFDAKFNARSRT
jgi:SpoVK/Ycf46/Vps4 family AAA+-type ATPase